MVLIEPTKCKNMWKATHKLCSNLLQRLLLANHRLQSLTVHHDDSLSIASYNNSIMNLKNLQYKNIHLFQEVLQLYQFWVMQCAHLYCALNSYLNSPSEVLTWGIDTHSGYIIPLFQEVWKKITCMVFSWKKHALHSIPHLQYTDSTHGPNSFLTIKHINSSKISQTNRFHICKWALSNEHCTTTICYIDTVSKNHPRIRFQFLTQLWNLKSNVLQELK